MSLDYSNLGVVAAETDDMSVSKTFEKELEKTGTAFLRLVGYVEFGRHAPAPGSTYKPALKTQLVFEMSNPKHMIDKEGKKVPGLYRLNLNKGMTAKSGYKKVFNMMNAACGGGHTHFFQMFGKPMLGTVYHNTTGEGDKKKTYANLDQAGAFSFRSTEVEDDISGEMKLIPVPPAVTPLLGFLWENASISDEKYVAMWDALYIEGTREAMDFVTKETKEVSKNWMQDRIIGSLDWEGSRLQALTQEHLSLDDMEIGSDDLEGAAQPSNTVVANPEVVSM